MNLTKTKFMQESTFQKVWKMAVWGVCFVIKIWYTFSRCAVCIRDESDRVITALDCIHIVLCSQWEWPVGFALVGNYFQQAPLLPPEISEFEAHVNNTHVNLHAPGCDYSCPNFNDNCKLVQLPLMWGHFWVMPSPPSFQITFVKLDGTRMPLWLLHFM